MSCFRYRFERLELSAAVERFERAYLDSLIRYRLERLERLEPSGVRTEWGRMT